MPASGKSAWCAIIYNHRRRSGDPFHDGYEQLLREYGTDYHHVQRQHIPEDRLATFFAPSEMKRAVFPNPQSLALEALEGRIISSSYMPQPGHPRFNEMRATTQRLFSENERDGEVTLQQDCVICYGHLTSLRICARRRVSLDAQSRPKGACRWTRSPQHSITFNASPASEVSLYRDCISSPVRYIVRIT